MKQRPSQSCHNLSLCDGTPSKFRFLLGFLGDSFARAQKTDSDKKPVPVCAADLSLKLVSFADPTRPADNIKPDVQG